MGRKLLIALDTDSVGQGNALTAYLQGRGLHFWHWMRDVWLVVGVPDEESPRLFWEAIRSLAPLEGCRGLVVQVDGSSPYWGGIAKDVWPWMAKHWGAADLPPKVATEPTPPPDC